MDKDNSEQLPSESEEQALETPTEVKPSKYAKAVSTEEGEQEESKETEITPEQLKTEIKKLTAELKKTQSSKDKEVAGYKQNYEQMQKQAEELRKQVDDQRQRNTQTTYRTLEEKHRREREEFGEVPFVKQSQQNEMELYQIRANIPIYDEALKHMTAYQLSEKTGIPMKELLKARTPDEMHNLAENSKTTSSLERQVKELQEKLDAINPGQNFDKAPSTSSYGGDEHWYENVWPKLLHPTKEQRERALKIHQKYMMS